MRIKREELLEIIKDMKEERKFKTVIEMLIYYKEKKNE